MRGKKFEYVHEGETHRLWHGIDKSPDERLFSRRLTGAGQEVIKYLKTQGIQDAEKHVTPDHGKECVFSKLPKSACQEDLLQSK